MIKNICLIIMYNYHSFSAKVLSSLLEKKGYKVKVIFFKEIFDNNIQEPTEQEYSLLEEKIKEFNPDLIGVSLLSSSLSDITINTIKRLKKFDFKIIVGGVAPTINPEQYIGEVDYLCIGEGENTILELVNKINNKKEINDIKGLWINDKGNIIKNNLGKEMVNLNELPIPQLNQPIYINNNSFEDRSKNIYSMSYYSTMTSRGCPFSCSYCTNSFFHKIYDNKGDYWLRKRDVDNVIEELELEKKRDSNLKIIDFHDDDLLYDLEWFREFSEKYKQKIGLPFIALTTFNHCDEERIILFKNAGGKTLKLGIQTGSERVRKEVYNRARYTNEQIIKTSKLLKKYKIDQLYDLIVDCPFETEEDKQQTLNLLMSLKRPFKLSIFSLIFFPKTRLTERALEEGFISLEDVENKKHKVITNWRSKLSAISDDKNYYYLSLYYLVDSVLPRTIIKAVSGIGLFKEKPKLLSFSRYVRLTNYIPPPKKLFYYLKRINKGIKTS